VYHFAGILAVDVVYHSALAMRCEVSETLSASGSVLVVWIYVNGEDRNVLVGKAEV
jgi:hypothetical protein